MIDLKMQAIKDLIPSVLANLQTPALLKRHQLVAKWPEIVGEEMAKHSQPKIGARGHLFVWVDQPVLAFEMNQKYGQTILKRVQGLLGESEIQSIRFFVGQLR